MVAYTLLVSYGLSALAFLGAAALLTLSRARNPYKRLLLTAVLLSFVWSACFALSPWVDILNGVGSILEPFRTLAWIGVVALLLKRIGSAHAERGFIIAILVTAAVCGLVVSGSWMYWSLTDTTPQGLFLQAVFAAALLMAVAGVLLIENLFRNSSDETTWAVKHLCFGLAALFAYDFFMSAEAALFARLDQNLFLARGLVNALASGLIVVSAGRSKAWPIDIHVSRRVVFHTVTLLIGGTYLLIMALTGYAVGLIDATWSGPLQVTFFAAAVLILVVVFSSGSVRAWVRQFIAENFFSYKYDYRDQWLRFIDQVSAADQSSTIAERITRAMANIVESTSGALWVYRSDDNAYTPAARWNVGRALPSMAIESPLMTSLSHEPRPIEIDSDPIPMPEEVLIMKRAWIVVPLTHRDRLIAVLVLGQPRSPRVLDWEDKKLLLTAGSQAASYLAEDILAQDLLLARRFEDLNRRFAFVVHDIKNLTGQMSLLVQNAERHGDNPDFQKDMLGTVKDGLERMRRLLVKLKDGPNKLVDGNAPVELSTILVNMSRQWKQQSSIVDFELPESHVRINGAEEGITSALNHIIQNAVDAVAGKGGVTVSVATVAEQAIIRIKDDGPGMDRKFLEHHLFRPLDSTKLDGYGIGAYQVRETVKSMGGRLDVTSEVGVGTEFVLTFPIAQDKAPLRVQSVND